MKKILWLIAIGSLTVLALAFATYIVLSRFSPEGEVVRMLVSMAQVKTVRQETAFTWGLEGETSYTTTLYSTGQLHLENPSEIEHDTRFRVVLLGPKESQKSFYRDLSGEVRRVDGSTYVTYQPPGPHIEGVDFSRANQWVAFSNSDERRAWGPILPGVTWPLVSSDIPDWSAEQIGALWPLWSQADVLLLENHDLTELVNYQPARILDARFDPDALRTFLLDAARIRDGQEPLPEQRVAIERQAKILEALSIRLWIGSRDHLLYRVHAQGPVPSLEHGDPVTFDFVVEFSDFNMPFQAESPQEAVAFNAMEQKVHSSLPEADAADQAGVDISVPRTETGLPFTSVKEENDPDQDGLDGLIEGFYGTNPKKADTDDDGVSDGEEIRAGTNPRGEGSLFGFGVGE